MTKRRTSKQAIKVTIRGSVGVLACPEIHNLAGRVGGRNTEEPPILPTPVAHALVRSLEARLLQDTNVVITRRAGSKTILIRKNG